MVKGTHGTQGGEGTKGLTETADVYVQRIAAGKDRFVDGEGYSTEEGGGERGPTPRLSTRAL